MNQYYKTLEKDLKQNKVTRRKLYKYKIQKALLRILECLKVSYPYLINTGIITGLFIWLGLGAPFIRDKVKTPLQNKKTIDSYGNKTVVEKYTRDSLPVGTLSYTTKWEKNEDGIYERNVETYEMKDLSEETVIDIINNKSLEEITLEDIFGNAKKKETEKGIELTEEEINKPASIKASVYSVDKNDVIIAKEDVVSNILVSVFWVFLEIAGGVGIFVARDDLTGYSFLWNQECITDEYIEKLDVLKIEKRRLVLDRKVERTNIK